MRNDDGARDIVLAILLAAILILFAMPDARSHAYYSLWKRESGAPCCGSYDCAPIASEDTRYSDGQWSVRVDGEWLAVPPSVVRPYDSPDGQSHLCNNKRVLYCFVPGAGV